VTRVHLGFDLRQSGGQEALRATDGVEVAGGHRCCYDVQHRGAHGRYSARPTGELGVEGTKEGGELDGDLTWTATAAPCGCQEELCSMRHSTGACEPG
jgi:hypothetical protein